VSAGAIVFQHFLITRFNYGWLDNVVKSRTGTAVNTSEWLDERVLLFETFCLPSVLQQTCQDFTWVMQFDPQTPVEIIKRCAVGSNVEIIQEPIVDYFTRAKLAEPFLMTSRLDNDDALHEGYIEAVQSCFTERTQLLDTRGIQFDRIRHRYHTDGRRKPNSPFLTLIEKLNGMPKTVHYADHAKMRRHFPARRLKQRLWCQVVHETNLLNRIRGRRLWWPDLSGFPEALQPVGNSVLTGLMKTRKQPVERAA
jgi:hypothetical protein